MRRLFLTLFLAPGLLLLPGCSSSKCSDFDKKLRELTNDYVKAVDAAKKLPETSKTWVPAIQEGITAANFALDNTSCLPSEEIARWQTIKQDLSLRLEGWLK